MNSAHAYTIAADGKSITCRRCGRTSYNGNDVAQRYCGYCHRFHEQAGARQKIVDGLNRKLPPGRRVA